MEREYRLTVKVKGTVHEQKVTIRGGSLRQHEGALMELRREFYQFRYNQSRGFSKGKRSDSRGEKSQLEKWANPIVLHLGNAS